jgi:F0F1-type ATP synthase alpha subunit
MNLTLNSINNGILKNESNTDNSNYIKNLIFKAESFGKVIKVKDGVAFVVNLRNVTFGELVLFIPSPLRLRKYRKESNNKKA